MESTSVIKSEFVKTENDEYDCEPMDVSEPMIDAYCEEGEISSNDEEEYSATNTRSVLPSTFSRAYNNNSGGSFITGVNVLGEDENFKKLDRAKRFAIPIADDGTQEGYKERLSALYRDLGIDKENERHYRFNAIHMRGTENMSTDDVFKYFIAFAPSHIEWLNDVSCNVVWIDDISTARALLNLSKRIKNLDKVHSNADPFEKEYKNEEVVMADEKNDDAVDARDIKAAIPPGFWRIGVPAEKSSFILLRYATRSDKKQKNAEQNSEYYKKYGNPHYGNTPGIISKSLRSEIKNSYKKKRRDGRLDLDDEMSSSQPIDNKNPWEELAYNWGQTDKIESTDYNVGRNNFRSRIPAKKLDVPDLRISLMNKKESRKRLQAEENSDSNENSSDAWATKQKIPRMKMYADDEEKRLEKKQSKRFHLNETADGKTKEDLRDKINRKRNLGSKYKGSRGKNTRSHDESEQVEYLPNYNYRYSSDDSGDWALEHYTSLRESVGQNRKTAQERLSRRAREESESETDEDDDDRSEEEVNIKSAIGNRSPLQIEIDNDEYYQKR